MNENTTILLRQLAEKLGTTSEYLWKILLKQAPIDATVSLIWPIIHIIGGIALIKIHRRLMRPAKAGTSKTGYAYYDIDAIAPMVLGLVVWLGLLICTISSFNNIVSGYFNPEYWAVNHILEALKK